jgi:membrane protein DedA with SNARE-associated domain
MKINHSFFEWILFVLMIGVIIITFIVSEDNIILHKIANFMLAIVLIYYLIYYFIKKKKNNK